MYVIIFLQIEIFFILCGPVLQYYSVANFINSSTTLFSSHETFERKKKRAKHSEFSKCLNKLVLHNECG